MSERLFVILEVKDCNHKSNSGNKKYIPADNVDESLEIMWLKPDRIIPASRLRYGNPKRGDWYFLGGEDLKWGEAKMHLNALERLILDPAPKEKDEWDEWAEEAPVCDPNSEQGREIISWLKRMPRKDK